MAGDALGKEGSGDGRGDGGKKATAFLNQQVEQTNGTIHALNEKPKHENNYGLHNNSVKSSDGNMQNSLKPTGNN